MTLAEIYAERQAQMITVYDGVRLRALVDEVLKMLPDGPLVILSTSDQGAGIAAAVAALREDPTHWSRVDLLLPMDIPANSSVVVVEPIHGGAAWREAVERRWPTATVVVPDEPSGRQALAA